MVRRLLDYSEPTLSVDIKFYISDISYGFYQAFRILWDFQKTQNSKIQIQVLKKH